MGRLDCSTLAVEISPHDGVLNVIPWFRHTATSIVLRLEHAAQCGHMTDELSWLQQWYSAQCDGEWEHGSGITIETLDNPGWSVEICVEGTELASAPFEPVKTEVGETQEKYGVIPFYHMPN